MKFCSRNRLRIATCCGIILLAGALSLVAPPASSADPLWGSTGHSLINLKAPMHLPASMAVWRADSSFYSAHASDADGRKVSSDTSFFAEAQRHYIDIDDYPSYLTMPHDLDAVIALYGRSYVRTTGTQPWATMMVLDSLTAQFRRGDIAAAKQSMSDLGHYVGDAHQPLHVTKNFDGQLSGNNGIHSRYETGMIGTYRNSIPFVTDSARYILFPLDYVFSYLYESNAYVDSIMAADVYAKATSGWTGSGTPPASYYTALWLKTAALTKERFQHATVALASLWYTAWSNAQTQSVTVTASAGPHGSISPAGSLSLTVGSDVRFTYAPTTGYHLDSVIVDDVPVDSADGYTFTGLAIDHSIRVTFAINTYIITASAGAHGTIEPAPSVIVPYGGMQIFSLTPDSGYQIDSVFVDEIYQGNTSPDTLANVTAPHAIRCTFAQQQSVVHIALADKWNMVSVPLTVSSYAVSSLFPGASSSAFHYTGGYASSPFMEHGVGYWLKFSGSQTTTFTGTPRLRDTLALSAGWNQIGSISLPVAASQIGVITPGLALSQLFSYTGGYVIADTILPGKGYWVKASIDGQIVLGSGTGLAHAWIVPVGEMPPPPPSSDAAQLDRPNSYRLEQNYPNPFNPSTAIRFSIPQAGFVTLKVYSLLGEDVATLVQGYHEAGTVSVQFNRADLPSGMYIYRMSAGTYSDIKTMMLIK